MNDDPDDDYLPLASTRPAHSPACPCSTCIGDAALEKTVKTLTVHHKDHYFESVCQSMSDSSLIDLQRRYKDDYNAARRRDDLEMMLERESMLCTIEETLCSRAKPKRCIKCDIVIAHPQLLGEERCENCGD